MATMRELRQRALAEAARAFTTFGDACALRTFCLRRMSRAIDSQMRSPLFLFCLRHSLSFMAAVQRMHSANARGLWPWAFHATPRSALSTDAIDHAKRRSPRRLRPFARRPSSDSTHRRSAPWPSRFPTL
jgi:hypothetical protein